jgi:hypothetical protein
MSQRYKNLQFQAMYDVFYNSAINKTEEEIKKFFGSNRADAFKCGYFGVKNSFIKTSLLYPVFRAGQEVRKVHDKQNKMKEIHSKKGE